MESGDGDRSHPQTKTEIRVLRTISQGKTNSEIARINYVHIETVKTHVQRIFKKLYVGNRMEAVVAARERQIIYYSLNWLCE